MLNWTLGNIKCMHIKRQPVPHLCIYKNVAKYWQSEVLPECCNIFCFTCVGGGACTETGEFGLPADDFDGLQRFRITLDKAILRRHSSECTLPCKTGHRSCDKVWAEWSHERAHGGIINQITRCLTRHGVFCRHYLHRFGWDDSKNCSRCVGIS